MYSASNVMSVTLLPSWFMDLYRRGAKKNVRTGSHRLLLNKQKLMDTYSHTLMHVLTSRDCNNLDKTWTKARQTKVSAKEGA